MKPNNDFLRAVSTFIRIGVPFLGAECIGFQLSISLVPQPVPFLGIELFVLNLVGLILPLTTSYTFVYKRPDASHIAAARSDAQGCPAPTLRRCDGLGD